MPFNCTKIVCTLGPASSDEKTIGELVNHGMAVARLNFSHGTHQSHASAIKKIRKVSKRLRQPVAVLQDLCGPKMRIGRLKNSAVIIKSGATLRLSSEEIVGDENVISASPTALFAAVALGERVLLDDGLIHLEITKKGKSEVTAKVIKGGVLRERKGINLPGATLSLPSLTEKDLTDLKFGIEHEVDLIALSFVRSADDVLRLKKEIAKLVADTPVIAKLEKPQAIKKLGEIIKVADAVMVARGDLGVEMPLEEVPIIQKNIITIAKEYHKPVITATQMLESMTHNLTPTRAEVSDVANAIFDGTDCVMLSAETASGEYPVEAVKMMAKIIQTTESRVSSQRPLIDFVGRPAIEFSSAIAESAAAMARDIDARLIACFTQSGLTARLISKQKTSIPIVAFTPNKKTVNRLQILRGVIPRYIPMLNSIDQIIHRVEKILKEEKIVKAGDQIVIVASAPVLVRGETNMLKLHTIGQ